MRALLVALVSVIAVAAPAAGATPVRVGAAVDRNSITLGDPIVLTLTVDADGGYNVADSGVGRTVGPFDVLETIAPQLSKQSANVTRYVFRYRVTAFRVGSYILPPIEVTYSGPNGERGIVPTAEIPIVVTSVIQPADSTDDVRPLKPQLRLPGAAPDLGNFIRGALGAVVLVMLALIIWQSRRAMAKRRAARPPETEAQLTPAQRGLAELSRIAELRLPEKGRYAEHYQLLAAALRAYVRDRFDLAATERTPRELREDMLRAGLDRSEIATIYEILREGEIVRFHEAPGYPARAQHALRSALDALRRAAVAEQYDLMQGKAS